MRLLAAACSSPSSLDAIRPLTPSTRCKKVDYELEAARVRSTEVWTWHSMLTAMCRCAESRRLSGLISWPDRQLLHGHRWRIMVNLDVSSWQRRGSIPWGGHSARFCHPRPPQTGLPEWFSGWNRQLLQVLCAGRIARVDDWPCGVGARPPFCRARPEYPFGSNYVGKVFTPEGCIKFP